MELWGNHEMEWKMENNQQNVLVVANQGYRYHWECEFHSVAIFSKTFENLRDGVQEHLIRYHSVETNMLHRYTPVEYSRVEKNLCEVMFWARVGGYYPMGIYNLGAFTQELVEQVRALWHNKETYKDRWENVGRENELLRNTIRILGQHIPDIDRKDAAQGSTTGESVTDRELPFITSGSTVNPEGKTV